MARGPLNLGSIFAVLGAHTPFWSRQCSWKRMGRPASIREAIFSSMPTTDHVTWGGGDGEYTHTHAHTATQRNAQRQTHYTTPKRRTLRSLGPAVRSNAEGVAGDDERGAAAAAAAEPGRVATGLAGVSACPKEGVCVCVYVCMCVRFACVCVYVCVCVSMCPWATVAVSER